MFKIVQCPDSSCNGVSIIEGETETIKCRNCGESYKYEAYDIKAEVESREVAVDIRTAIIGGESLEDLQNKGFFTGNGNDIDEDIKRILSIIKENEPVDKVDIIQKAVTEENIDVDYAEDAINKLSATGKIFDSFSGYKTA